MRQHKINFIDKFYFNRQRPKAARSTICNAPTTSIYFGVSGEMMGCCVNRDYLLGTYPQQNIKEAWTSTNAKTLRASLKKGELNLGCQGCYELIKSKSYNSIPSKVYDTFENFNSEYPKKMDFELSNKCNLECVTCRGELSSSIRKNRDKLPPLKVVYDDDFVNELEEFVPHLEKAYFAGGEPFLIPIYEKIWEKMALLNPKIHITVQTNGTLLTDRIKQILNRLHFNIAVSIDAIDPETFNSIRKNAEHETVFQNIEYFSKYCQENKTELTISFTPMILNWMEIPKAIQFCNDLKCKIAFNNLSYPKKLSFSSMSFNDMNRAIEHLESFNFQQNDEWEKENYLSYKSIIKHLEFIKKSGLAQNNIPRDTNIDLYLQQYQDFLVKKYGLEIGKQYYNIGIEKLNEIITMAEKSGAKGELINHLKGVDFDILDRYLSYKTTDELAAAMKTSLLDG